MNKTVLILPGVLPILSSCATNSADEVAHYRAVHENVPIAFRVTSDVRTTGKGGDLIAGALERIPGSIESYLAQQGIEVAQGNAPRRLDIAIGRPGMSFYVPNPGVGYPQVNLLAKVTYTAPDGTTWPIESTVTWSTSSDPQAAADYFARLVVDEALLMWYPADPADGHSLVPLSETGKNAVVAHDAPVTLAWEAFPSERLLAGSPVSSGRISDVVYDLRVGRYREFEQDGQRSLRYAAITTQEFVLESPSLELGEQVPWCGDITWTVRARFMLDGHPRVTAWSRQGRVAPPGVGLMTRVGAPGGFDCYALLSGKPVGAEAAWASEEPVQLVPLSPDDGVASIVLTGSRCAAEPGACSEKAYRDRNRELRRGLEKAIGKVGGQAIVHDGADLIDPAWFGDGRQGFAWTPADLHGWLADPASQAALADAGITRVVAIHAGEQEHRYSLTMLADIIDVATNRRIARLDLLAYAEFAQFFDDLIVIETSDAFEEGIDSIASIVAYALMGARIGWPKEFRAEGD